MPGVATEITLEQFSAEMGAAARGGTLPDLTRAMRVIAGLCRGASLKCFQESRGPSGEAWPALKSPRGRPRDKRARAGGGNHQRPLLDRGILQGSVASPTGQFHVSLVTPSSLVEGTNLDYAAAHQHGARIGRPERRRQKPWVFQAGGQTVFTRKIRAHVVVIPARPFIGWSEELMRDAGEALADAYGEGLP